MDIYGKAPAGQNVTVNDLATTRQGTDFRCEIGFDNSTAQRWEIVTTNGGSLFTAKHHIPAASTTPTYDLDGNQTSDGQWTYTWDAENRLTSATRSAAALAAGAPYRAITYRYDSKSRKITRSVATTSGGPLTTEKYLYDGWNCIAEYSNSPLNTANFQLTTSRLWGLDLSGTPQGAGGVGGLLSISDMATATTHYPCYDGNGNVRKLLNATTLVTTATYDYGPFGELVRATGPYALSNPYRFSTKPQDSDTRLYYYGYRYYDPLTGRWPSRDPIGEKGGVNLYNFVRNDGVNRWDVLGLTGETIEVKECEAYLRVDHGSRSNPLKWKFPASGCAMGGAVTCFPESNNNVPSSNHWPNLPNHDDKLVLPDSVANTSSGDASTDKWNNELRDSKNDEDHDEDHDEDFEVEHSFDKVFNNATNRTALLEIKKRLCKCCKEITVTLDIVSDGAGDSRFGSKRQVLRMRCPSNPY